MIVAFAMDPDTFHLIMLRYICFFQVPELVFPVCGKGRTKTKIGGENGRIGNYLPILVCDD